MAKKKFNLSSDMIEVASTAKSDNDTLSEGMTKLTLYVPKNFSKQFKAWCAMHEIPMSKVIQEMFQKYKELK